MNKKKTVNKTTKKKKLNNKSDRSIVPVLQNVFNKHSTKSTKRKSDQSNSSEKNKHKNKEEKFITTIKSTFNSKKIWKILLVLIISIAVVLLIWSLFFKKSGDYVSQNTFTTYIQNVYDENYVSNYPGSTANLTLLKKNNNQKNILLDKKNYSFSSIVFSIDSNQQYSITINDLLDKKAKIVHKKTVFTRVSKSDGELFSSTSLLEGKDKPDNKYDYKVKQGHWGAYILSDKQKSFVNIQGVNNTGFIIQIVLSLLPIIIIIIIFYFAYRMMIKNKGMMGGIGLPFRKTIQKPITSDTRFDDVAGYTDEKNELLEIFDILKTPDKYKSSGARIPKGVLLIGEPGTGKTLLAKAVAGEAKVPFFYISGSEFVELFIGMGAQRVRTLFTTAKKYQPCIIFIDELDTIGRQRGANIGNTNDEREQTLNQLLVEMDGFNSSKNTIIILGATNRFDTLDKALLRPGRFDRIIRFHKPTWVERLAILKKHIQNKNVHPKVDLKIVAKKTPGFTGAQLENVINEATLLAIRSNRKAVILADVEEAIDRVIGGLANRTKKYVVREKKIVSYHESGHALAGLVLDGCDEVQKITIIPRGEAGGYTLSTPKEERFFTTKQEIIEKVIGLLAGRAAEEIMFGASQITTGAHNDIKQATHLARAMVLELGMTKLGNVKFDLNMNNNNPYLFSKGIGLSEELKSQLDNELRKIMSDAYERAKNLINDNKDLLGLLATGLLKKEVLNKEDINYIYKNRKHPEWTDVVDDGEEPFVDLFSSNKNSRINNDDYKK